MNKKGLILFLYCIPYLIGIYLLTYYFDYVVKEYPAFLPAIVWILLLIPIYIGLGCLCGRNGYAKLCVIGTAIQLVVIRACIAYLLLAFNINNGSARVWFPIWAGFIIGSQLIGYWGSRKNEKT